MRNLGKTTRPQVHTECAFKRCQRRRIWDDPATVDVVDGVQIDAGLASERSLAESAFSCDALQSGREGRDGEHVHRGVVTKRAMWPLTVMSDEIDWWQFGSTSHATHLAERGSYVITYAWDSSQHYTSERGGGWLTWPTRQRSVAATGSTHQLFSLHLAQRPIPTIQTGAQK